jgi:hypothetical protein
MSFSGMWLYVVLVLTDVSEERITSAYPEDGGDTFLRNFG